MNKKLLEILKHTSRSVYLSIAIMPKDLKNLFAVAYLLCRTADTIADTLILPCEIKLTAIKKFPQITASPGKSKSFTDELIGKILPAGKLKHERILIETLPEILNALSQLTKTEKELICVVVGQICKGMEIDLAYFKKTDAPEAFQTYSQLENYCRYIGGAPGAFWAKSIILHAGIKKNAEKMVKLATSIGEGLQITNILKDLSEDIKNKRCYLPVEDLKQVNLTPKNLLNPSSINTLKPVLKKWIKYAVSKLDNGEEFMRLLPKKHFRFKSATIWPIYWCMDTLQEIYKSDELLNPRYKTKIAKSKIYLTILKTPPVLISNYYFDRGFRFRRETLLSSMSE
jgi:farnesyl-diphosphate farnesyltransferase